MLNARLSKTGPVEPGIGPASGPVNAEKRSARESGKKPLKPKKLGKIGELAGSSGLAVEDFFFSSYFQYDLQYYFFLSKKIQRKKMKLRSASFP
jgi:hypothetical protein